MTLLLPKTAFRPGLPADPLDRRIGLARLSLLVERLAPALWPALGFIGLYLAAALFGLFAVIPWTLQALLLAATITATALSLSFTLGDVRWPRGHDGARRLERDNGLAHRPISERDDVMAGDGDAFAQALWRRHRTQTLAGALAAAGLKVAAPRPSLEKRDPKNLRYGVLIALAAGLIAAHGQIGARLFSAIDSGAGAASVDAWIDPPGYTGLPLMSLSGHAGVIAVPAGSVIALRVHGAMRLPGLLAGLNTPQPFTGDNGEYASNTRITQNAHLRVRVGGHVVGKWNIVATPDKAPSIAFTATPSATLRQAVKFSFRASDDYGVASARAILTPHGRGGAPLSVDLPLESTGKSVDQASYADLTGHPYAGLMVDARLEARDALGQVGVSRTVTFRLPARVFTDPLARALIEQRQNLATADRKGRQTVAATLDALTIAPELFYDGKTSAYLAIRAAFWGIKHARGPGDIAHVEDLLWQTAVALERGGLLTAAEELRKLQQELNAALASGAPQEVIDELLNRYNDAMKRYLQALAANPPPPGSADAQANARTVTPQDIQNLLNLIQQLAKSGAREQAAQMMAVLQNMLENMHVSQGSGSGNGQDKALNDAIQKFGEMIGKQRALLDKTMRQENGQADPKDGGPQGLANQQGQLQKQLNDALKTIDPKLAGKLGSAGKAMGEAQKSLGARDLPNAGSAQTQALEALRQGAQALAEQAAKESGQQGQNGQQDPLGRTSGGNGATVKIPPASDLARARAILEELRKRAGEMGRSQQERDYIDRLLKAF